MQLTRLDEAMLASMPRDARRQYLETEEAVITLMMVLGATREVEIRAWLVTASPEAVTGAVRIAVATGEFPPVPSTP